MEILEIMLKLMQHKVFMVEEKLNIKMGKLLLKQILGKNMKLVLVLRLEELNFIMLKQKQVQKQE